MTRGTSGAVRRRATRRVTHLLPLLGPLALAAGGCQTTPTHLAYVHNMNLGVDLSASTNEGNVKLAVGFDRKIFALVPRTSDADEADAMSVFSASRVVVAGIETTKFGHVVATGEPAVSMAKAPEPLAPIVHKVFDDKTTP